LDSVETEFDNLKKFITLKNCKEGYNFNYIKSIETDSIKCDKCDVNHYRTSMNSTCIHCPEGFIANSGSTRCIKSKSNNTNVHTLCPIGTIIGEDPYAHLGNCKKCSNQFKKYMPYNNNNDECLTCGDGSVVDIFGKTCTKCPIGTYENNNKCIMCPIGTYTNKIGMNKCTICNNDKALAFISINGNNCDDFILHSISENIKKNIINLDTILNPLSGITMTASSYIINNHKYFESAFSSSICLFPLIFLGAIGFY